MSTLPPSSPLGSPLPSTDSHAVTVSLGTWSDFVKYKAGDPIVVGQMKTGYPRYYIHPIIRKVRGYALEGA